MIKELEGNQRKFNTCFVNFHGLKYLTKQFYVEIASQGVDYKVSRKTLLVRALKGKAEGEIQNWW